MSMTNVEVIAILGELANACRASQFAWEDLAASQSGSLHCLMAAQQAEHRCATAAELIRAARRRGAAAAVLTPPSLPDSLRSRHGLPTRGPEMPSFGPGPGAATNGHRTTNGKSHGVNGNGTNGHSNGHGVNGNGTNGHGRINGNGHGSTYLHADTQGPFAPMESQPVVSLEQCLGLDYECLAAFDRARLMDLPFMINDLVVQQHEGLRGTIRRLEQQLPDLEPQRRQA